MNGIQTIIDVAISTPIVLALSAWLGKVWASRILLKETAQHNQELEGLKAKFRTELETYKAEVEKTVFVTRVHFETEFAALKEIFQKLAEIRLRVVGLRPFFSISSQKETKEERLSKLSQQLEEFGAYYNELLTAEENLKPFYSQDVYREIEACRKAANREIFQIRTSGQDAFTPPWYEKGIQNQEEFLGAYERVAEAIRHRIAKLTVIRS